jgi:hypothetical protein
MKLVLCRQGFTNAYVQEIRKAIPPEFRVTETALSSSQSSRGSQYLCVLFGSRQTQAMRNVKIQPCNARNNSYMVSLSQLGEFLTSALKPPLLGSSSSQQLPSFAEQPPHQSSSDH